MTKATSNEHSDYEYAYDKNGNIDWKKINGVQTQYTYDTSNNWPNRLTSMGSLDLTYDDFTAEFDLMADGYYQTNYWAAFAFRKDDYYDWYNSSGYMVYYRYNGSIELHEAGAGVLATSNPGLDLSAWRHVKITTSGSSIAVYVDGNLEISHEEACFSPLLIVSFPK